MKIWAHTLVKNEERYLWFAVTSVIDYVDKLLLWDTGSSDTTVHIAKELKKRYPSKIEFKEVGNVDINEFTSVRQEMLKVTKCDWFLIVDGDEVWWDDEIRKLVNEIKKNGYNLDTIVTHNYNLLGDIFHYDPEKNGDYQIDDVIGHINVRAINRRIKGLNVKKPHGQQGFFDGEGTLIQNLPKLRRMFITSKSYLHFTHLPRSDSSNSRYVPKRRIKLRRELGIEFPNDFYYPEVFFRPKPDFIPSPWISAPDYYKYTSLIKYPRGLKKMIVKKSGY